MPESDEIRESLNEALQRSAYTACIFVLLLVLLMFLPAGFDWARGWFFLTILIAQMALAAWYLRYKNPAVIIARSKFSIGIKSWDKPIMSLVILSFALIFPTAGFDHRFHCSHVSFAVIAGGYALFTLGMLGSIWVMAVNKFAEPGVRIQTERGHRVVDSGPYAIVRHPLYAATFFSVTGFALAMGSYVALVPAGASLALLVVRTTLEDRLLRDELAGYREYAGRVRFKLLPGVW